MTPTPEQTRKLNELLDWLEYDQVIFRRYVFPNRVELQFNGWALVLLANGTWYPLDTSGG